MKKFKIAVIPGDGIGKEVILEGVKLLEEIERLDGGITFSCTEFPWGCGYYKKTGKMAEDGFMEILNDYDAVYLGAVGDPDVPDNMSLRELLFKIRQGFDEYVNLRPIKLLKGAKCPLNTVTSPKDVDIIVVRENSEGEYSGAGERLYRGT